MTTVLSLEGVTARRGDALVLDDLSLQVAAGEVPEPRTIVVGVGSTCTTAGSSCVITGLTNGTDYQVTVTATNSLGTGPTSAPVSVRPTATPVPPAAQTLKKPPAKLKKGKKAKLAKTTRQGAKVTWKTSTKKTCTVKKYKVTAKKKGKCKLSANAPAIPGYTALTKKYTIRVK